VGMALKFNINIKRATIKKPISIASTVKNKIKSPGISSYLKGYCLYTPNDLNTLDNVAWGGGVFVG